jgi:hypothetical protein
VYNAAIDAMRQAGAVIVDPANFDPTITQEMASGADETTVLNFDFKAGHQEVPRRVRRSRLPHAP